MTLCLHTSCYWWSDLLSCCLMHSVPKECGGFRELFDPDWYHQVWLARSEAEKRRREMAKDKQQKPTCHKQDWDAIWQKHLETGYGGKKLARLLNIPEGTVYRILAKYRKKQAEGS